MSTKELQKTIIDRISLITDEVLLTDINQLLDLSDDSTELYPLTSTQIEAIVETQNEVKAGNYLTSEEAGKEIDKWLEE